MAFNVNDIRSQLTFGGARASHFQVQLSFPGDIDQNNAAAKAPFMIKASSFPSSNLGTIEVPYFGRRIKLHGDRTFEPWSVTVINDEDFMIRNAMEDWMASMNAHVSNVTAFGSASPSQYKANATITQFSKTGVPIRRYTFNGLFPVELSAMDANWESQEIQEFNVTFQYDWWSVNSGSLTGTAGTQN